MRTIVIQPTLESWRDKARELLGLRVPPDDVLTSRIAGEQYDNAVEAWGEEGWARVSRLCRFFDTMGMRGLDCPPPPRPG